MAGPGSQAVRRPGPQTLRLAWDRGDRTVPGGDQEWTQQPARRQPRHGRLGDVTQGEGHLRPEQVRGGPQCVRISSWGNETECRCHQQSVFGLYLKCDECLYNPEVIKANKWYHTITGLKRVWPKFALHSWKNYLLSILTGWNIAESRQIPFSNYLWLQTQCLFIEL